MQNRDEIIKRLLAQAAEVITPGEFEERLHSGQPLTHYIGFEISGYVHIGQGIMSALIMKDLVDLGVKCTIWLADWHTWINDKLDGDKTTAANIGTGYFAEAIRASFAAVGGDPAALDIQLASAAYARNPMEYWETVIKIGQHTTDSRIKRSITIMGREAGGDIAAAKLFYPLMQAADVFFLKADIAHAGLDQRKAYVVMRDAAEAVAPGKPKPLVLLHHLLPGLTSPDGKMSKSDPGSAIFIHDTPEEINQKIRKAYAPEKDAEHNPVLAWTKHLLFWNRTTPFVIERKPEHGGTVQFDSFEQLAIAYQAGDIHPLDLKTTVATELSNLLEPVRQHFAQPDIAAKKAELDRIIANR